MFDRPEVLRLIATMSSIYGIQAVLDQCGVPEDDRGDVIAEAMTSAVEGTDLWFALAELAEEYPAE